MDKKKLMGLIKKGEGTKVDFKQKLELDTESGRKELAKDICAIGNSKGGRGYIIIGIEDKTKKILGIENDKYFEEQIQQIVSSRCEPPIPVCLEHLYYQNKQLIIINIYDGPQKPYQLRENGSFYIRRGSTTDTMRKEEIVSSLQESLSLNLELCPIINSSVECINMDIVNDYFNLKGLELNEENTVNFMENASIIHFDKESNKHAVTLGGLLVFSDINNIYIPHNMIKIINNINKNYDSSFIIQGNLLTMLDECEIILKKVLPKYYPIQPIYEGISNAILYRDYTLYYKEIEVVLGYNSILVISPGILVNSKEVNSEKYLKRNMWIYEKLITLDNRKRFSTSGRGFKRMRRYFKNTEDIKFINSIKEDSFKIIYPGVKYVKQLL
ncbi:helix-turn-helix domain-containing protein [Clostridium rectalis]|uniref:AlbA family DNA-binding domain-containing protein n=1 Tax=Clostridium rectalis TaxID=2040295 RepID=UPI000F6313EE|nr:RNA-binding domain-containing protein [Clostridium rectalis]